MMRTLPLVAAGLLLIAAPDGPPGASAIPIPRLKPSIEELANFAEMPDTARRAMVEASATHLVERLAQGPDDVDGWLRLAQARTALGEHGQAILAFERAVALAPESPSVLRPYARALLGPAEAATGVPRVTAPALALYRRLARIAPDDPEPYWYLGLAAFQAGDVQATARWWQAVLDRLEPDHPDYAPVRARLQSLRPMPAEPEGLPAP
jgi:cytochrome c-type biogenesis protein CcmH